MCFPLAGRSREVSNFDFGWQFARYGLQPDCTRMEEPQGLEAPGHDDSHWRPLDLPHDWGVEGPFRTELEGNTAKLPWGAIGWYRKHFHVGKDLLGKKLYLDFDGAMANAQVWVNGRLAGGHPYGYTSFRVDITPFVAYGCENVVAVRLNTEQLGSRWYPGAGIYRHVRLVSTERVHVDHWGVFVRTPQVNAEEASALVRVDIENHLLKAVKGTFSVEILETDANDRIGRKVVSLRGKELQLNAGAKVTDSLLLRVKRPVLWSVEHPARYVARVKVFADGKETDCYDQPFDFRTIQFSHDEGFLLNGKKMKIQGTCNHHDLDALGTAVNGTELQVDVHGMNYAVSAYGGKDLYGTFLDMPGHEHIVGYSSEISSTISSRGEYFPRKFQVTVYDTQEPGWDSLPDYEFAALERYPAICGEFVWTGFDYLGEPTPFNSDNSVLLNHAAGMTAEELEEQRKALEEMDKNRPTSRSSYFCIVDLAGFPKDRYYLYQSHWLPKKPMAHVLPHWNHPGKKGQHIPVYVYTSGQEAELFLNGKSLGRKRKGQYEYRLKWGNVVYVVYEPGELKVVAYKDGRLWAEDKVQRFNLCNFIQHFIVFLFKFLTVAFSPT